MDIQCSFSEHSQDRSYHNRPVAGMLYVPDQEWEKIYKIEHGFYRGTVFAELDKPWLVGNCHE